ncbi:MAG: sigma-70 family RNA polymerase sigma factor [Eubacteriales bacterium]|nr:sigma-70 family RNA polymerase sigma factor [Eubacteriales bacterium]
MDDEKIIGLYFDRNQDAIAETDRKYGSLCRSVSFGVLSNHQDAEECVSDTYLAAWEAMPPKHPEHLGAWLCKVCRNLSLMRLRERYSVRRGAGEFALCLDELGDTFAPGISVEQAYEQKEFAQAVNRFLHTLPETQRNIFLARYYLVTPIADIARRLHCSQSKVKTSLFRTRKLMQEYLKKEELV